MKKILLSKEASTRGLYNHSEIKKQLENKDLANDQKSYQYMDVNKY